MAAKVGFIGAGNMGFALISGLIEKGVLDAAQIAVYDAGEAALARAAAAGCMTCGSAEELAKSSEIVLAAIKPQVAPSVFEQSAHTIAVPVKPLYDLSDRVHAVE